MKFVLVTLFPEMFDSLLAHGVLGKAIEKKIIAVEFVNPRDFTESKHGKVDDTPYGGGPGMVIEAEPVLKAMQHAVASSDTPSRVKKFLLTPCGTSFTQSQAEQLAQEKEIVLICGRYEGIDERIFSDDSLGRISTGDFVVSGGEVPAMAVVDAVARLVPGVLGDKASTVDESFNGSLLEYPHYTKPREVEGHGVPEVLVGGNHQKIEAWRKQQSIERTLKFRPDLIRSYFNGQSADFAKRVYIVLAHHPVTDRNQNVVTTSVTNLDIHDIARTAKTYGLAGFCIVTPVDLQKRKVEAMVHTWNHDIDQKDKDDRLAALELISVFSSVAEAESWISKVHKKKPVLRVCTSARKKENQIHLDELKAKMASEEGPIALILGTGWGLTQTFQDESDYCLKPLEGQGSFNHLSVRSAAAIYCDKLFGAP